MKLKCLVYRGCTIIIVAFGTGESVLFIEVSLIQRCPYREVPPYCFIVIQTVHKYMYNTCIIIRTGCEGYLGH